MDDMRTSGSKSPLENWAELPLLGIESLSAAGKIPPSPRPPVSPFLIVAPHPDDETLGCGGAIALLRQLNYPVQVLMVSDGTKSHPNSCKYPAPALRALRKQESIAALAILGVEADAISFLFLPDGAVPTPGERGWEEALSRCQTYLKPIAPATIFLPWRGDPHRDHRASWKLIDTAIQNLSLSPRLIEYPIWDWDPYKRQDFGGIRAWRLNIESVWETKQKAIAQYRSQITDLIDDDLAGFRLSPEMLANFAHPWEIYLEG